MTTSGSSASSSARSCHWELSVFWALRQCSCDGDDARRLIDRPLRRRPGVVWGVEEGVPEGAHRADVGLGLEDQPAVRPARGSGTSWCAGTWRSSAGHRAGAGLPCPFQISGLDGSGGGDQLGDLVLGTAGGAPVADVAFGRRLDAVLDPDDTGDVRSTRLWASAGTRIAAVRRCVQVARMAPLLLLDNPTEPGRQESSWTPSLA